MYVYVHVPFLTDKCLFMIHAPEKHAEASLSFRASIVASYSVQYLNFLACKRFEGSMLNSRRLHIATVSQQAPENLQLVLKVPPKISGRLLSLSKICTSVLK